MKTYTLHRIGLLSAFKFGFVIGLVIALLPAVAAVLIARDIVLTVTGWLASLTYALPLSGIPGIPPIEINGVDLLKAGEFQAYLQAWASLSVWQALLLALGLTVILSILTGLGAVLGALVFNVLATLSGGLELSLSEGALQAVAPPQAQAAVAPPVAPVGPRQEIPGQAPQPVSSAPALGPLGPGPRFEISAPVPKVVALTKPSVLVGSAPDCDVVLPDLLARHAQVKLENGRYILYDLSGGRTWVQNRPVTGPNMVKDGFTVQFGQWIAVFRQ